MYLEETNSLRVCSGSKKIKESECEREKSGN